MAAIPRVRRTLLVAAAALVATVGLWGGAAPASSAATIDDVVGVHRFYNMRNGTHFYTASIEERDGVLARWPSIYKYEGLAYYVDPVYDAEPLYRFYNVQNGSHFYTASAAERDGVRTRWPHIYTYEGVAYNVSTESAATEIPVYRFYNKKNGSHFYTTSTEERDGVIARWPATYTYEGPRFYASASSPVRVAIANRYGTFETQVFSGTGTRVIDLPVPVEAAVVELSHSGSGYFGVTALDAQNEWVDLLANEIDSYHGVTAMGLQGWGEKAIKLQVEAAGEWAIKISPVAQAPVVQRPFEDSEPAAVLWSGGPSTWNIEFDGSGYFGVKKYYDGPYGIDGELVVNEVGPYSGSVAVPGNGPSVVTVEADGAWRIS